MLVVMGSYSLRSWWQGGRKHDSPSPCDPATDHPSPITHAGDRETDSVAQ
jgi:hypothetical protein